MGKAKRGDWRPGVPSPACVNAHAERYTFLRYEPDDPGDPPIPAFGLWFHRRSDRSGEPPRCVALRVVGQGEKAHVVGMDRCEDEIEPWQDGEWRPATRGGYRVPWPQVTT